MTFSRKRTDSSKSEGSLHPCGPVTVSASARVRPTAKSLGGQAASSAGLEGVATTRPSPAVGSEEIPEFSVISHIERWSSHPTASSIGPRPRSSGSSPSGTTRDCQKHRPSKRRPRRADRGAGSNPTSRATRQMRTSRRSIWRSPCTMSRFEMLSNPKSGHSCRVRGLLALGGRVCCLTGCTTTTHLGSVTGGRLTTSRRSRTPTHASLPPRRRFNRSAPTLLSHRRS